MDQSVYVLDADVFIEASRRYYAFDIAPKFWDSLIQYAANGMIESIDRVLEPELNKGKDELARWANDRFSHAFCSTDEKDVIESYGRVMTWVQGQSQYTDAAKADFAKGADGWLVAYAMAKGRVVVTHEVLASDARRKVSIPNVCEPFRIRYVDTFVMLRELGVRFS
jgi:hypothetical protein